MTKTTGTIAGRAVARVGFGAMQLPGPGVFGPPRDRDQAIAVLRRAIEAGVNHIDTAQYYGPDVANELIREALYPYPDDLVIVSKVGAPRRGRRLDPRLSDLPSSARGWSRTSLPRDRPTRCGQHPPDGRGHGCRTSRSSRSRSAR